ncbi:ADS_G0043180.mRNA.1.CDS.1 [Saccharomyces cerevisiae]|nr:ADS_G0043180.mRNA.1.CDS.1 [Saccharomyces cerevisiae]CAI6849706.1 ADS_G0043180.mRNA.1.CDS.1 [Saccharomyces cerevisiae]
MNLETRRVDVLSLYKQLESQKIVLPQDLSEAALPGFVVKFYKSLAFRIWMLLWLPLSVWWKFSNNCILPTYSFISGHCFWNQYLSLLFVDFLVSVPYRNNSFSLQRGY